MSSEEMEERRNDEIGEKIRVKYANGVFRSSMVSRSGNEYVFKVAVNESQWKAMDQGQQHRLTGFVLKDFRKEFCASSGKVCRVVLEGLQNRRLASSTSDYQIQIGK